MFDLGDELTLESYRIPWLIWAQLLVMLLLLLLLFCLSLVSMDRTHSSSSSSSDEIRNPFSEQKAASAVIANRSQNTQIAQRQVIKGEISEGTSGRVMRMEEACEEQQSGGPNMYFHPCYYVRLARTAFLKCLGLDSTPENCSTAQRRKKKDE